MKKVFVFLIAIIASLAGIAQGGPSVSRAVKNKNGKTVALASVSLMAAKDSALVNVAVTDAQGLYVFSCIKDGSYFICSTSVGYTKTISALFSVQAGHANVPAWVLAQSSKDLGAVTITARKPFIETKIDHTVVNVEASPMSAGATALDVLEKLPGIAVSTDGVVSLRGKPGVMVMLNGKPTYLSDADLANF